MALPGETREETFERVLQGLLAYEDDLPPIPGPNESKTFQTLRKVLDILENEKLSGLACTKAIMRIFEEAGVLGEPHHQVQIAAEQEK